MKPKPIYLVATRISKLGDGYEAFRSLPEAIEKARAVPKLFGARKASVKEVDLWIRRDPTLRLQFTWGADDDNHVSVVEVTLS